MKTKTNQKEKSLSIRMTNEVYDAYTQLAIDKSNKEKRIVKMSEVIRETLEKRVKK